MSRISEISSRLYDSTSLRITQLRCTAGEPREVREPPFGDLCGIKWRFLKGNGIVSGQRLADPRVMTAQNCLVLAAGLWWLRPKAAERVG